MTNSAASTGSYGQHSQTGHHPQVASKESNKVNKVVARLEVQNLFRKPQV